MITILSAFVSVLSFRVRNRASLELELIASIQWRHGIDFDDRLAEIKIEPAT